MTLAVALAAAFLGLHLASIGIAIARCRKRTRHVPAPAHAPAVSLVRPVCGLDNFAVATLASSFDLDYPDYEIIFCAASARDPVVPLVRSLIDAHPSARARLLIGDERISTNPKLNNCCKGWIAATHDWIVFADSNVLMPRDYLARLMAAWQPDTGLVCSPPAGAAPLGLWAEVECAFLNTYQARAQYLADTLGFGFAQGKTMLWRRDILEAAGGITTLGEEVAEDAAATKVVRTAGLRVRLVDAPFAQPLGARSLREVWQRQARWAQLRRASFPLYYLPEIFGGAAVPLIAALSAAIMLGLPVPAAVAVWLAVWYGAEMTLAAAAGWPVSASYPAYAIVRDLMLPVLWVYGWAGSDFVWRGHAMSAEPASEARRT